MLIKIEYIEYNEMLGTRALPVADEASVTREKIRSIAPAERETTIFLTEAQFDRALRSGRPEQKYSK